jgi:hypothetical protein
MNITWDTTAKLVPAPGRPGQLMSNAFAGLMQLPTVTVTLQWVVEGDRVLVRHVVAYGDVTDTTLRLNEWTASAADGVCAWFRDTLRRSPAEALRCPPDGIVVGNGRVWNDLSDDHLREVATVFEAADTNPIRTVANHFQISYSTARGRVTTARKRGLLGR